MKKSKFLGVLLFIFMVCFFYQKIYAWGFYGHRKINEIAVFSLPPEMVFFFKPHIYYIINRSTAPDQRRYISPDEAPRHYLDIDHYGEYPYPNLPHSYKEAVEKFTEDSLLAHGIVPWHIETMCYRLRHAFEAKDELAILKNAAEMGHYIADACVPLHASGNHNGQLTGQDGIHGLWESKIPELLEKSTFNLFVGKCDYIENKRDFIWTMFLESAALSDSVLRMERELNATFPADKKYAIAERGNIIMKDYSPEYITAYNNMMNHMVEDRMRRAINAISSFWYSSWVDAGQPELNFSPIDVVDTDLDELNLKWKNSSGNGFGRDHE